MTMPVSYVEINSSDAEQSRQFLAEVFGWEFQPFARSDYLVAPAEESSGVDTGSMGSRDGIPRAIPVIRVRSLDATLTSVSANDGAVVVPPFEVTGVGRGAYVTDPCGVLIGLHEYDADR